MYRPKVSIIIPVYNGSNFLKEAIDSALNQTYKNLEIIVVNDGSCDDGKTEDIALSYGNKIKYFKKVNGGVSSALNFALEKSTGEWFSWLSHDDLYYSDKIEKQIRFLDNLLLDKNEDELKRTVLHSATVSIDANGKIIKKPDYSDIEIYEDSKTVILDNIYNYRLSGCSFLVNRDAFNEVGPFREDIKTVSDVEYWHRLLFHGYKFCCLKDNVLVKNRSHGKQVGKTKVELFNNELNELYQKIFDDFLDVFNPTTKEIEKFYFGMVKRRIAKVAKRIKRFVLKERLSSVYFYILLPIKTFWWGFVGYIRNVLRFVFRLIFVYRK